MSKENLIKKQSLYMYMPSQARPRDLSRDQHVTYHMTHMLSVTHGPLKNLSAYFKKTPINPVYPSLDIAV